MQVPKTASVGANAALHKSPTGILGLDEILEGGLPQGRPCLICGGPGCGKTLLAMEFLVQGARAYNEPGLFVSFEETLPELRANFASLGFDIAQLEREKGLFLDYVHVDRADLEECGDYRLDGLFVRIGAAIDNGAVRRVVLDTAETLFSALDNQAILRSELKRLFAFLKDKGVTAIVTGEQGDKRLTRHGLEEYVADCVISLSHSISQQVATRRLCIIKYRGSSHITNEVPFLIGHSGITVIPVSSLSLSHPAPFDRVSTGIHRLDAMLSGQGYYRGSSVLITGTAGTGKSSLAAHFANSICLSGQRCLYLAFEESQAQIVRNMRSIGIDLATHLDSGILRFRNERPTLYGLEMHLAAIHEAVREFDPAAVVIDPVSNLVTTASAPEVRSMLARLIDYLKTRGITALCTDLSSDPLEAEKTDIGISSLMDTWILLQNLKYGAERNRGLFVLKSRGMAHSNQIREFTIGDKGIELTDVYVGDGEVLMGSARLAQQNLELRLAEERGAELERLERSSKRRRKVLEAQIASLQAQLDEEAEDQVLSGARLRYQTERLERESSLIAKARNADSDRPGGQGG